VGSKKRMKEVGENPATRGRHQYQYRICLHQNERKSSTHSLAGSVRHRLRTVITKKGRVTMNEKRRTSARPIAQVSTRGAAVLPRVEPHTKVKKARILTSTRLEGEVSYNHGEFAEVLTYGTEEPIGACT
jgi:hypothetical protein